MRFTGKATTRSISLPDDFWNYLDRRVVKEGRKLSTIVRRALEKDIANHASRLVDTPAPYTTEMEE